MRWTTPLRKQLVVAFDNGRTTCNVKRTRDDYYCESDPDKDGDADVDDVDDTIDLFRFATRF